MRLMNDSQGEIMTRTDDEKLRTSIEAAENLERERIKIEAEHRSIVRAWINGELEIRTPSKRKARGARSQPLLWDCRPRGGDNS